MTFETLVYTSDGPIATITLNRPNELNTIVPPMPDEFETAINLAVKDASIKVIILRGAGRSFCAGYDFGEGFHLWDEHITTNGAWDAGKDFAEIIAGAKRSSGAAQNDDFDRGVLDREIDRGLKFVRHGRDNGIEFIWTIKRDRRHWAVTAIDERLECHGLPLPRFALLSPRPYLARRRAILRTF